MQNFVLLVEKSAFFNRKISTFEKKSTFKPKYEMWDFFFLSFFQPNTTQPKEV